jgi:hypothetical protein
MCALVATKDPKAVEREVRAIYLALYPQEDPAFVLKPLPGRSNASPGIIVAIRR